MQHNFMHLSLFRDDFKEFVDTLLVALREIEKAEAPIIHIHPAIAASQIGSAPSPALYLTPPRGFPDTITSLRDLSS